MHDALGRQDLPAGGAGAEAGRQIERTASVPAAFDRDGLAGVETDSHAERDSRTVARRLAAVPLNVNCRLKGSAGRGEDNERLVASELD